MTYNTSNTSQDVKSAFLKHCEQLDITNNKDWRLLLCARLGGVPSARSHVHLREAEGGYEYRT